MAEKIKNCIKNNHLWLFLVVYGFFIMFYKWSGGSFMGDEATYSQIAKESLHDHSFFILHWKGNLWMEKPPIMIWLTALAFRIWGISETSAHIFPGLFSTFSATILYFLGKELFKSKMAGFFAGFVFLTTPIIVLYSRVNMMDIPVGAFIALSALALWKIFNNQNKWWIVFGLSLGLGVMTKSVIGLLPLGLLITLVIIYENEIDFKNKYFLWGFLVFLAVTVPWHLFMTIKFGNVFWSDYFGFHIWDRFSQTILPFPWEGNSRWGYIKLFWFRSGIWFLVFLTSSLFLVWEYFWGIKNEQTKCKNAWFFLYAWLAIVFFPFFFSVTKLPNYMILSYFPVALIIGGSLGYFWKKMNMKILFVLSTLSLLNFLPSLRLHISDFGEAHVLFPKIFIRYGGWDDVELILLMLVLIIIISIIFLKFHEKTTFLKKTFFFILIGMNVLVPFAPQRNEFIKQLAADLARISDNKPVMLYVSMKPDHFSFQCVGAYYLPLESKVENLGQRKMTILSPENKNNLSFCFVDRGLENEEMKKQEVFSYDQGTVFNCEVEK